MIKLLVPSMPSIESIVPYIRRAEEARWYSNFGQNVLELERRLAERYAGAYVVCVSSCTAGLELVYSIRMIQGYAKVELPALTFPATWLAANRGGLEIVPIDVDPDTWIAPGVAGWGVPSYAPVVDAAAAFGEQKVPLLKGGMTAVFSMHATKPLPAAEGGFVVTWDQGEADELRAAQNFGFRYEGEGYAKGSTGWGTNAKMSEYHAAIGLAALDAWDREPWLRLFDWYKKYLPECVTPQQRPRGVYPIISVKLGVQAQPVLKYMNTHGVECRRWYTPTMEQHPMFFRQGNREHRRKNPTHLPITMDLSERLLGLPYHLHLTESDVRQVCERLEESIHECNG